MGARGFLQCSVLAALVMGLTACGDISRPLILGLQADEDGIPSHIDFYIPATNPEAVRVELEGGLVATMTVEISLLDLLSEREIVTLIQVDGLLLAGTPFAILGLSTEEVCVLPERASPGSGLALIDLAEGRMDFNMLLDARVEWASPLLRSTLPEGIPLSISLEERFPITPTEMLRLLAGDGGGLSISKALADTLPVVVGDLTVPIGVEGRMTLAPVESFPEGALLEACAEQLGF